MEIKINIQNGACRFHGAKSIKMFLSTCQSNLIKEMLLLMCFYVLLCDQNSLVYIGGRHPKCTGTIQFFIRQKHTCLTAQSCSSPLNLTFYGFKMICLSLSRKKPHRPIKKRHNRRCRFLENDCIATHEQEF